MNRIIELRKAGSRAEEEKLISVLYEGVSVGNFAADILVEDKAILELKAVESLCEAHEVQTVNYLTATGLDIGLLINFGSERLQFKRKFRLRKGAPQDHSLSDHGNPVHPVEL
jgi:GxxExxY protein